jgi:hypothetical protein
MHVVRDEPQQVLVLESTVRDVPRGAYVSFWIFLLVLVYLLPLPPWKLLRSIFSGDWPDPLELVLGALLGAFWVAVVLVGLSTLRQPGGHLRRLSVDRRAGEMEIAVTRYLLPPPAPVRIGLDRLRAITVASVRAPRRSGSARLGVRVRLEWLDGREKPATREISFPISHVDKREEVADFTYRLGRAAGLAHARVLRSDARDVEIELLRESATGAEVIPLISAPADYARDIVTSSAVSAVAQEKVPPFSPTAFKGSMRVAVWEPRREVRFRKPMGFAAVAGLPFVALALTGPVLFFATGRRGQGELFGRLLLAGFAGFVGLIVAALAYRAVKDALPRVVTLDWTTSALSIGSLLHRRSVALSDLVDLELKCVATVYRRSGSSGMNEATYKTYRGEVIARLRDPAAGGQRRETLIATDEFREDRDTPYRMALPLVTQLATALGVKRRVSGFG